MFYEIKHEASSLWGQVMIARTLAKIIFTKLRMNDMKYTSKWTKHSPVRSDGLGSVQNGSVLEF